MLGILLSRVRKEEKLLLEVFESRRIPVEIIDDRQIIFNLQENNGRYNGILERCINHARALYALRIFKDRGVIRVFDYARSTRFMPIAGKKIPVDNIIAVARPDEKMMKGRENRAIAATAGRFWGTAIGGDAGDVVYWGSVAGNVTSDFVTREKLETQRIKCEILEF